uniref:Family with sequence similarity 8 member A1a n=1 Tax=Salarias fasciatus TaxID=181472 RepID=A0A672I5D9_SALFA
MTADTKLEVDAKPPQATATTEYCAELQRWMWRSYWCSAGCQSWAPPPGTHNAPAGDYQLLYDTRHWHSYPYLLTPGALSPPPPGGAQTERGSAGTDKIPTCINVPSCVFCSSGREYTIPSPLQRFLAETVDFCILFCVKVTIVLWIMHLSGMTDIAKFITQFIVVEIDENTSLEDLEKILAVALAHRVLVCVYETVCIWGAGGATPGKFLLGLQVVTYDTSSVVQHNRVLVVPATDVSLSTFTGVICSLIRNLSIAFLIPVFITLFFFRHNRTAYDVVAGTIVVQRRGAR